MPKKIHKTIFFIIYTGRFFGPVYREENLPRGTPYAEKLWQLFKLIDCFSNDKVWHMFSMPVNQLLVNAMPTIKLKALLVKSRSAERFSESLPKQSVYCIKFKPNEWALIGQVRYCTKKLYLHKLTNVIYLHITYCMSHVYPLLSSDDRPKALITKPHYYLTPWST